MSKDWFYFALIGYMFNIFSAVGAWFLPESPRYLCERGKVYELERSLKAIAKVNGIRRFRFNSDDFKDISIIDNSSASVKDDDGQAAIGARFYLKQRTILINLCITQMSFDFFRAHNVF